MLTLNTIASETIRLFIPVLITVAAGIIFMLCAWYFVRTLRQQIKLYNSITLVQLRRPKLFFIIVTSLAGALTVYCMILSIYPAQPVLKMLSRVYGLDISLARMIFISLTVLSGAITMILFMAVFSRAAVVDRGIYIGSGFIDWHHIYDYYVDEKKNSILLSTNKLGPLTLGGTTALFKFNATDIEKIKFILNKNKNKFIPRYELR